MSSVVSTRSIHSPDPNGDPNCLAPQASVQTPQAPQASVQAPQASVLSSVAMRIGLPERQTHTERRHADRLRHVIEWLPSAVVVIAATGRVEVENRAAQLLLGGSTVGLLWAEVVEQRFEIRADSGPDRDARRWSPGQCHHPVPRSPIRPGVAAGGCHRIPRTRVATSATAAGLRHRRGACLDRASDQDAACRGNSRCIGVCVPALRKTRSGRLTAASKVDCETDYWSDCGVWID